MLTPVLLLACAKPATEPWSIQDLPGLLAFTSSTCNDTMTRCQGETTLTPGVVASKLGAQPEVAGDNSVWGLEHVRVEMYPQGAGVYTVDLYAPLTP